MTAREALAEYLFTTDAEASILEGQWSTLSVSARALWYNKADAVLRVLAEHGDTEQVREQVAAALALQAKHATALFGETACVCLGCQMARLLRGEETR